MQNKIKQKLAKHKKKKIRLHLRHLNRMAVGAKIKQLWKAFT